MTDSDFNAFMRLFRSYFRHICSTSRKQSLLARIYGVYSVKMGSQKPVKMVVMGNTMRVQNGKMIRGVFDLKGSMVNRFVPGGPHKPTATLKDKNLINVCRENIYLRFKVKDIRQINDRLREDATLLRMFNLMDYSVLLCIEENPNPTKKTSYELGEEFAKRKAETMASGDEGFGQVRHQFISECGKWIYHLSVIDYLQDFNLEKRMESFIKISKASKENAKLISASHPDLYATRFINFMKDTVVINQTQGANKDKV